MKQNRPSHRSPKRRVSWPISQNRPSHRSPKRRVSWPISQWNNYAKEARRPLCAALCPSAGKAGADTLWAAGVGVAVLPDGQPKLAVDARKNQIVGGCVVAACVAGFHRIVVKSLPHCGKKPRSAGSGCRPLREAVRRGGSGFGCGQGLSWR